MQRIGTETFPGRAPYALGLCALAVGVVLALAGQGLADNRIDWEPYRMFVNGHDWYVPMISVRMDPYGVTDAYIQSPGAADWQELTWEGPRQRWYWRPYGSLLPTFDGQWGLQVFDSNGQPWNYSFVVHPMAASDFPPVLAITLPATQYETVPPDFTFEWNANGADQDANHLWMQITGDAYAVVATGLPLSTTQWSPGNLPLGDAKFAPTYAADAPDKLSDFTCLSGPGGWDAPAVNSYLLSLDYRYVTVSPEPASVLLLALGGFVLARPRRRA
jgi:hypothetical protein